MSNTIDHEFEALVELDIQKLATEDQQQELMEDLELWRDTLLSNLRAIETQLAEWRTKVNKREVSKTRYESWKATAVARKTAVLERLTECKALLKEDNRSNRDKFEKDFNIIARELSAIRKLLEERLR